MQLTRIDRWLREKYVYETHVYTLRRPEAIPAGVIAEELPDIPGRQYRHRFIVRDTRQVDSFLLTLKNANQMFTTRVVDRDAWYVPYIAPEGRSVVWWVVWAVITVILVAMVLSFGYHLWSNPETRKNIQEAFKLFKDG